MSEATFDRAVNIRTTPKAQRALNRVVANLKASDRVRWRGGAVTKEAVVNASWLLLDAMDEGQLEALMARHVAELEALLGGRPAAPAEDYPVSTHGEPDPPTRPARRGG